MKENYEKLLQYLENNPRVKLDLENTRVYKEMSKGTMEMELEELEDEEWSIPDNISDYLNLSNLCISWEGTILNVSQVVTGGFKFNGIVDALTMPSTFWKGAFSLAPGNPIPDELLKFKSIGWFEHQPWEDGRFGCFDLSIKEFPPKVFFYNNGWFTKMNFTLDEYLVTMFEMYGIKGWQFFYIDIPADIPYLDDVLRDMMLASEQLPLLFPEKDWSYQINKYKETIEKLGK